jgi:hypothetical protein
MRGGPADDATGVQVNPSRRLLRKSLCEQLKIGQPDVPASLSDYLF